MADEVQRPRRAYDADLSLASRLTNTRIRDWVGTQIGVTFAASEKWDHPGIQRAADALTDYGYHLTPRILDDLRRAGLLLSEPQEEQ